ncbi:MAG: tetratricopeptide repeat protein [Planctomycetaceae bacterium]|nr:tetratricopeptide repeat protein [Planctomycetaceae bacterium]
MTSRRMLHCRTESAFARHHGCLRQIAARVLTVCILTSTLAAVGCRSLRPSDHEGIFAGGLLSTDGIRGPLERSLSRSDDPLQSGEKFSPEGQKQVEIARNLYDQQKYEEAIKVYKKLTKKYENSSIGEEAWFYMGECYFALKDYPKAQDSYDKLFADYPSTKYVADTSERMFQIARIWLEITDPVTKSNIKSVSHSEAADEAPSKPSSDPTVRYGLLPNFHNRQRPVFDTAGRARNALKSIWLNDPTGPLADDALMLTAAYYLRRNNYIEADRYLEILRDEYPDSPHLEDAFVLGGHVKQMSYQGPYYDGTTLISAENLKERTLQMFPASGDREQVRKDLQEIYLMKAQRAWASVDLWKRKDNPRAVVVQAIQVANDFPDTRFGAMARQELRSADPNLVKDLPGVLEFIQSLPEESEATAPPSEKRNPVKSVSFPDPDQKRPTL